MLGRSGGVSLFLLLLAIVAPVHAQTPSGEISGTVVDSSGLPVPGVTVTLINRATNVVRVVKTNEVVQYALHYTSHVTYVQKHLLFGVRTSENQRYLLWYQ